MQKIFTLVFPHQLFLHHPAVQPGRVVVLVEEWLFFNQYRFHKQKLVLHRAAMQYYMRHLQKYGIETRYVDAASGGNKVATVVEHLAQAGATDIYLAEPADDWLCRRLAIACRKHGVELHICATPGFINQYDDNERYMQGRKTYFQTDFYTWQRKRLNILMDDVGKPAGGKWTYDTENRQRFPKNGTVPQLPLTADNPFIDEAVTYINDHFAGNPGQITPVFAGLAVTHADAAQWLADFIEHRFEQFGAYEDAMVAGETVLHHSVLTPALNAGLLTPAQVINAVLHAGPNIPLNSLEGFVRQVLGWREFVRLMYHREGRRQRTTNYWKFSRKIPACFYTGTTGIEPVDIVIRRVLQTGYCHHIERLMVLGNFMLLCEFDPDDVYRWFMELFIDAYDWVMVPNIYGMSQFADGGLMCTKPYISGSNYIMKMSDFKKGTWQEVWDGLFWRFIDKQRYFFVQNPRLGMMVRVLDKMAPAKKAAHLKCAEAYLQQLGQSITN